MFLNAWKIHQEGGRRSLIIADNEDLTIQIEIRRVLDNSEARYHRLDEEIDSIIIYIKTNDDIILPSRR